MIYEKRTYTINPLKMADWLALYQSDALAVQNRPSRPANRLLFYRDRRGQSGSAHLGL